MTRGEHWRPLPSDPAVVEGEVHVVRLRIDGLAAHHDEACRLLAPDEERRAGAFHKERDRTRYVLSRVALRVVLGAYLDVSTTAIELTQGEFGKPALTGNEAGRLDFNVSHADDIALLAFATQPVGIDVERVRDDLPYLEMAERLFSPSELDGLKTLDRSDQVARFFDVWVRKESYVKALGLGLSIPTREFTIGLGDGAPISHPSRRANAVWTTHGILAAKGYAAAIAMEEERWFALFDVTAFLGEQIGSHTPDPQKRGPHDDHAP